MGDTDMNQVSGLQMPFPNGPCEFCASYASHASQRKEARGWEMLIMQVAVSSTNTITITSQIPTKNRREIMHYDSNANH